MAASSSRAPNLGALEVEPFTRARLTELASLRASINSGRTNRRVHQQLAWHLRRRTLSHSSRRAPASIRSAHVRELSNAPGLNPDAAVGPKGSRRLRKYRAKARFLRAHRALRNGRPSRLETHEWHAKRFRMQAVPGTGGTEEGERVVAERCNDRGVRSAFKGMAVGVVAHDASYLDVVRVTGEAGGVEGVLRSALARQDADRVLAAPVVAGHSCARGLLSVTPAGRAIAPVDALFRPSASGGEVWLWVHPAASSAVAESLRASGEDVDVSVRRGDVVTIALRGPRAGFILGAVLERADAHGAEWDAVRYARSAACAPAGAVLAGEAVDPRSNFPPKRVREHADASGGKLGELSSPSSRDMFAAAPIDSRVWDLENLAASDASKGGVGLATMPFILLNRPAGLSRGLGAGWDIVVPKGWGRPLWLSLMYANGSRVVGLTEWRHFELETGQCVFPDDFPDSLEGDRAMREGARARAEKYYRKPKSKRVDYGLYRVGSPFFADLQGIDGGKTVVKAEGEGEMAAGRPRKRRRFAEAADAGADESVGKGEENTTQVKIDVLRDRKKLRAVLRGGNGRIRHAEGKYVPVTDVERQMRTLALEEASQPNTSTFVRASIKPVSRGLVLQNALICSLSESDILSLACGNLPVVKENLRRKGDEAPSRTCIGRVVHGNYSMARGIPVGIAFLSLEQVQKLRADARVVPRERRGRGDAEGVQVRVLVRNVDSLQYRVAVATVAW